MGYEEDKDKDDNYFVYLLKKIIAIAIVIFLLYGFLHVGLGII